MHAPVLQESRGTLIWFLSKEYEEFKISCVSERKMMRIFKEDEEDWCLYRIFSTSNLNGRNIPHSIANPTNIIMVLNNVMIIIMWLIDLILNHTLTLWLLP